MTKKDNAGKKAAIKSGVQAAKKSAGAVTNLKQSAGDTEVDLSFLGSRDEAAETRTIASRARVRSALDIDVEAFLSSGGKIDNVADHVMGDPPRKPESNYGSRPI